MASRISPRGGATAGPMTSLTVVVRPGSARDEIAWDPWRGCWTIACRARAVRGQANASVADLLADRLGVARAEVRCLRGASSRRKTFDVAGLSAPEIDLRLRAQASA